MDDEKEMSYVFLNSDSLRELLAEKRLSYNDLAVRAGLDRRTVARLLHGKVKVRHQALEAIANALDLSGEVVWEGEIPFPVQSPPKEADFAELLKSAMDHGIGKTLSKNIIADSSKRWLSAELAYAIGVSERTLSSWRTGRGHPTEANLKKLLDVMVKDHAQLSEWKAAFIQAHNRNVDINRASKRVIPEVPSQSERAISFGVAEGKVRLDPSYPNSGDFDDHFLFFREEALDTTRSMISGIPPASNELGEVRDTLLRYVEALGDSVQHVNRTMLWREGRRLRRFLRAEKQKEAGSFSSVSALSAEHFGQLEEIVTLHNSLSASDTMLAEFDKRGADPADQNLMLGAQSATNVIVDAAASSDIIHNEVPETLLPLLQENQNGSSGERMRDLSLGVGVCE